MKKVSKKKKTPEELQQEAYDKVCKRTKDLENLDRNLIKKLYTDLFTRNAKEYTEKNLTFENFLYHFYGLYLQSVDYRNADYEELLEKLNYAINEKFESENGLNANKNKRELMTEYNKLSQDDEWTLIEKYQKALYEEQIKKEKEEESLKHQKYLKDLDNQIEVNKNYVDPIVKKKDNIYSFEDKELTKLIERSKVLNQNRILCLKKYLVNNFAIKPEFLEYLEKQNFALDKYNKDIIEFKISYLEKINNKEAKQNVNLPLLCSQIIYEDDLNKIKKNLNKIDYKKDLINQMNYNLRHAERTSKMTEEERKMNKQLLESAKNYFNQKYKLNN